MIEDIILKEREVEASLGRILGLIKSESGIIQDFSNLVSQEFELSYKSTLNNKVLAINTTIISKLNNLYKKDMNNYTIVQNNCNELIEIKNKNIRNIISEGNNLNE